MELLQWHKVCELGGDKLHRHPVVALTRHFWDLLQENKKFECKYTEKKGFFQHGNWINIPYPLNDFLKMTCDLTFCRKCVTRELLVTICNSKHDLSFQNIWWIALRMWHFGIRGAWNENQTRHLEPERFEFLYQFLSCDDRLKSKWNCDKS